ncbi:TetR/AcrR family transcriptional regulator [Nocardia harenae]|uniref:TetR/AcrR family transcriptional regulator n=1 Tax=Nocardia harenae TaxID=358707 RepID=UPI000832A93D|nr:TetR/AcrR family transcriptional regulator [Nocardia harenae]
MRDALLRAGATHFSKSGYAGASIRDILADAGATAPALYHHFGNKPGLYIATATEAQNHVFDTFRSAVTGRRSRADRVSALLDAAVALRREHPYAAEYLVVVDRDIARHPELGELAAFGARFDEFWRGLVGAQSDRGTAIGLRALVQGVLVMGGPTMPITDVEAGAQALQRLLRAGIDSPPRAGESSTEGAASAVAKPPP